VFINLTRGEIRLWLYLSEPLCQRISADLGKSHNAVAAFAHLKPLIRRTAETIKMAGMHHHLSRRIHLIGDKPNLDHTTPHWFRHASRHLGAKIGEWAQVQLAQYLRNSGEEFKRVSASHHDGVTLRITMTRIPGIEILRDLSHGKIPKELSNRGWPKGMPAFQVTQRAGHVIRRLRN
jgi:hypothetical protein